jgi:hypothetical protein
LSNRRTSSAFRKCSSASGARVAAIRFASGPWPRVFLLLSSFLLLDQILPRPQRIVLQRLSGLSS